jgi:pentatricopeptide repeat protein
MSAADQNTRRDPSHLPNENEENQPIPTERHRRGQDGPSAPPHKFSLNSDIHGLRRQRNGILLAEKRLEAAIEEMLKEAEKNPDLPRILHEPLQTGSCSNSGKGGGNSFLGTDDNAMRSRFPDTVSFNSIISSHAKNALKDSLAARKAEGWLQRMHELSGGEAGFAHLKPTTFTYNGVMEAYFNSRPDCGAVDSAGFSKTKQESISRLYQEVERITCLSPNTYTRNIVLASQAPESEDWMRLESWAQDFFCVNTTSSDVQQGLNYTLGSIPDRQTFNTLLKRYAEIGNAEKAESFLRKLLGWYQNLKPQGDGSSLWLEPSKVWFHCVLRALAASKDVCAIDSEKRAEYVLQEMLHLYEMEGLDHLQPDTSTYNHVMNIHALRGNIEGALQLLDEMEKAFASSGNQRPDCVTYTTVIKAYATFQQDKCISKTSSSFDPAESAMGILKRMRKRSIDPSIVTCKYDLKRAFTSIVPPLAETWKMPSV